MRDMANLETYVSGPTLALAAKVKGVLEASGDLLVKTEWGSFYVSQVELRWYDGGESEIVGYLVPDDADGSTYDFYTPTDSRFSPDA